MKTCHKFFLTLSFLFVWANAFSQNNEEARTLVKQGVVLNDSGKYAEAIDKYNQALKIDPYYENAYYEMGYTLFTSGKEQDAIGYLVKLIALNPQSAGAFDMLGSIYDDLKQSDKAIEYYKQGIKANASYQRLHFNLAIAYYRQGKYPESEASAIEAIKLDPKHASSQRIYAMATYQQSKRGCSLLAWCSFLTIEPQSKRSSEAMAYVKDIQNYGIKRTGEKSVTISVSPKDMEGPNFLMPMSVLTATLDKNGLTKIDSLTLQLKSVFEISGNFGGKLENGFYKTFFF
jgi:tetratricopeptide (TPR) repeat protein